MRITLSDHFTYQKLLRFTMPSIVMMIVTSVYSIVDGFFVSNCVGKNAFAALNLIFPVLMALSAFGFMVGTGGSALIAKTLGEGKTKEANGIFSMLVAILAVGGAALAQHEQREERHERHEERPHVGRCDRRCEIEEVDVLKPVHKAERHEREDENAQAVEGPRLFGLRVRETLDAEDQHDDADGDVHVEDELPLRCPEHLEDRAAHRRP